MKGFTMGGSNGIHDPIINGKNYDQSSNYHRLGETAADNGERKLADNPRDFEERTYIGQNQNGSRDFIAEHDSTPQFHDKKTGENYSEIYNKRSDPKGERDPLKGTGYRTVGVAVAEKRYVWGQIRPLDQGRFHKAGLDARGCPIHRRPERIRFQFDFKMKAMSALKQSCYSIIVLGLLVSSSLAASPPWAHQKKIYAVFRNETIGEVKVRIESPAGYSVFGVAPRRVHVERVYKGSGVTVTTLAGETVAKLNLIRFGEVNFDNKHQAYYYRVADHMIVSVPPNQAKGWWAAGSP
jgi:hypothetical protein